MRVYFNVYLYIYTDTLCFLIYLYIIYIICTHTHNNVFYILHGFLNVNIVLRKNLSSYDSLFCEGKQSLSNGV